MNVSHACAAIAALDLSTVRTRLMHPRAGLGWSAMRASAAESDYREFLLRAKLFPEDARSPMADVDSFWHFHILDTTKYVRDCEQSFGYFLHHQPEVEFDSEEVGERRPAYCSLTATPQSKLAAEKRGQSKQDLPAYCTRARQHSVAATPLAECLC
jgi:hypothetical protein